MSLEMALSEIIKCFTDAVHGQKLSTEKHTEITEKHTEITEKIMKKDGIRLAPLDFFDVFIDRATNNATIQPQKPQLEFVNNFNQDVLLTSLSFVPDAGFKTKGTALVKIDDKYITIKTGALTDTVSLNIPLPPNGIKFAQDKKIQVFIWNGTDATDVSLTMMIGTSAYIE